MYLSPVALSNWLEKKDILRQKKRFDINLKIYNIDINNKDNEQY